VDVKGPLTLVDAIDGALLNTCLVFDIYTRLRDYVRHVPCLSTLVPANLPANASSSHAGLINYPAYYLLAFAPNEAERHTAARIYDEWVNPQTPAPREFLESAAAETRVVVRYRIDGGLTDALGELVSVHNGLCTVRTRRSDVVIPLELVVAAKEVPPAPPRRRARFAG
jgi:hypothetical protein